MSETRGPEANANALNLAIDIATRLFVVAVIVFSSFKIFSPFLTVVVWGMLMAIALHPVYLKLVAACSGRHKVAGPVFILVALALVLVPSVMLTNSVIDGATRLGTALEDGTLSVPPPSESVHEWPLIGESIYKTWSNAHRDLEGTTAKLKPQIAALSAKLLNLVAGLGLVFLQVLFAIIIAGILMMNSHGAGELSREIATRLAGNNGPEMVDISVATIRSVVKGVLLVAIVQSLLSVVGMLVVGIPGAGFWALLVLIVAIMQLPPILILGPITVWVLGNSSTTTGVIFLIWSLMVSGSDTFLKPFFLGRGVKVPMLVILIGAIGGMLRAGVVGLFIGPVILSTLLPIGPPVLPGSRAGLLPPSPLRTAHVSFPTCRSSLSNAP